MAEQQMHHLTDRVALLYNEGEPIRLTFGNATVAGVASLVECFTLQSGRAFVDHRLSQSAQGKAFSAVTNWLTPIAWLPDGWEGWCIRQEDATTGIIAEVTLERPLGLDAYRATTTIRNQGEGPIHLTACSAISATLLPGAELADVDVLFGRCGWMSESRWERRPIDDFLRISRRICTANPRVIVCDLVQTAAGRRVASRRWELSKIDERVQLLPGKWR